MSTAEKLTLVQTRALTAAKAGLVLHFPHGPNARVRGYHVLHTSVSDGGRIHWSTFKKAPAAPYDFLLAQHLIEDQTPVPQDDEYGRSLMRVTSAGRRALADQSWPAERLKP